MFETTDGLLTWAVEHMPAVGQPPQPALRLPLHRAVYLDYEGPVSGDRGRVIRVQAGTYRPASLGQCAAAGLSQHDLVQYDTTQQAAVANDSATDKHLAFVCRGCDADGRTVAQLVLLDRVEECDWELRSIIAPPR
ncbi:hypothetical protein UC8_21440 [Roseimaritima ulvae]|uniref:Uncharacterized protein n=2 Tax=Roseimaritima ulvae TaxID=980254 RepID=A0A5B9QMB5_9BACT|nr:hypothetical protein UC8_21440 [Roseimaritima ulvae]